MYIQRWIEAAWAAGFDREGCHQLGGKLYGKSTWIGATEVRAGTLVGGPGVWWWCVVVVGWLGCCP
jgi:hypothetical protein